ncbi:MAG: EAL domain-containing protein, partial [Pseudomonadota bacterium]
MSNLYTGVFDNLAIPALLCKQDGSILAYGKRLVEMMGISDETSQIEAIIDFSLSDLDDIHSFQELVEDLRDKNKAHHIVTVKFDRPPISHLEIWFENFIDNEEDLIVLQFIDASDKLRMRETYEYKENLLDDILENAKDAVVAFDRNGNIELFSPTAEKLFKKKSLEMMLDDIFSLFCEESLPKINSVFEGLLANPGMSESIILENIQCLDDDDKAFPVSSTWFPSGKKSSTIFFVSITDMTLLKKLINSVNDAYIRSDDEGKIIDFNEKAENLFDFSTKKNGSSGFDFLDIRNHDDENSRVSFSELIESQDENLEDKDYLIKSKDGEDIFVNFTIWPHAYKDKRSYNSIIRDVTHKKLAEKKLIESAYTDSLTSLSNRAYFLKSLQSSIDSCSQNGDESFSLLLMDLDGFKSVNDTLGHDYGDELLNEVAVRLRHCLRENDVISRIGGDEFTVIILSSERSLVANVSNRLLKTINNEFFIKGEKISISASIGVSVFPTDASESKELIKAADLAMYYSKNTGKNKFKFFTHSMHVENERRSSIEKNLRSALSNNEFYLVYQPKVRASGNYIYGVEALIRWKPEQLGEVGPAEFIPIAEQCGLIVNISRWVFREAVTQICQWKRQYSIADQIESISVNVSADHFGSGLLEDLKEAIKSEDFDPSILEIEITESAIMENIDEAVEILHAIKKIGVTISMDDFGTGYSSLQYLKLLPLDNLKIDRVFVKDIASNDHNLFIVEAIISIANQLNLGL